MQQKKLRQKHLQAQQEAREQEEKTRKTKVQMNTSEHFEEQRRQAAMERALVSPCRLMLAKATQTHALHGAQHAGRSRSTTHAVQDQLHAGQPWSMRWPTSLGPAYYKVGGLSLLSGPAGPQHSCSAALHALFGIQAYVQGGAQCAGALSSKCKYSACLFGAGSAGGSAVQCHALLQHVESRNAESSGIASEVTCYQYQHLFGLTNRLSCACAGA